MNGIFLKSEIITGKTLYSFYMKNKSPLVVQLQQPV